MKTKNDLILLGTNKNYEGLNTLNSSDRKNNLLVLASPVNSKSSNTLKPLINQDIENGLGVIVVSSDDDLVRDVVTISNYHKKNVIYFNTSDSINTNKFNPLDGDSRVIVDMLTESFKNCIDSDDIELKGLFTNAISILKSTFEYPNLKDLYYLLTNADFRGNEIMFNYIKKITSCDYNKNSLFNFSKGLELINYFKTYYENKNSNVSKYYKFDSILEDFINNTSVKNSFVLNREEVNQVSFDYVLNTNSVLAINISKKDLNNVHKFASELIVNSLALSIIHSSYAKTDVTKSVYINDAQLHINKLYTDVLKSSRFYNVNSTISMTDSAIFNFGNNNKNLYIDVMSNLRNILITQHSLNECQAQYYINLIKSIGFNDTKITVEDILNLNYYEALAIIMKNSQYKKPEFIELTQLDSKISEMCRIAKINC